MSAFTRSLVVEVRSDAARPFVVSEPFDFHSGYPGSGVLIRCERGFDFDGTSMPAALRWLISPSDPALLQCSAIHDKGFRDGFATIELDGLLIRRPMSRQFFNGMMAEAMIANDVAKWKQHVVNTGLSLFSTPAWRSHRNKYNALRTDTTA